ncbi:hypothetical protein HII31_13097 [Pseudocercospora fuligena]|uniref:Uncharacterized protein n=1 Tax=Pseudocercospora fuligena TaxID=685502 RepID=A0A8H6VG15_9PEZI|nr:hypothetical protein HII31_13097 [Pseudocercospora fuligena]
MDYSSCSRSELERFLCSRKAKCIPEDLSRNEGISTLEQLDQEWTFRFMDLPPELRDRVYEALLTRDKEAGRSDSEAGRKAHLQILPVSKKVHKEAIAIFQDVTPAIFNVIILRECYHVPSPSIRLSINGDYKARCTKGEDEIGTVLTNYPGKLPSLTNIRLHLTVKPCCERHDDDPDYGYPTTFMSAFVEHARSLRKLAVIVPVTTTMRFDTQRFLEWFDPLTKLDSGVVVKLYGFDRETRVQLKGRIEDARSKIDAER